MRLFAAASHVLAQQCFVMPAVHFLVSVMFSKRFTQKICQHAWASTPHWICLPLGKHLDSSHKDIAVLVCLQDLKCSTDKRWYSIVNTDRFIQYTKTLGFMWLAQGGYFFNLFSSSVTSDTTVYPECGQDSCFAPVWCWMSFISVKVP